MLFQNSSNKNKKLQMWTVSIYRYLLTGNSQTQKSLGSPKSTKKKKCYGTFFTPAYFFFTVLSILVISSKIVNCMHYFQWNIIDSLCNGRRKKTIIDRFINSAGDVDWELTYVPCNKSEIFVCLIVLLFHSKIVKSFQL